MDYDVKTGKVSTLLVVDDDPSVLDLVRSILKRDGYNIFCAENGQAGMEMAATVRPDLILLDLQMPTSDGVSFLRDRILDSDLMKVPVVMLTNSRRPNEIAKLIALGVREYLLKPIDFEDLRACVRRNLEARKRPDQDLQYRLDLS